MVSILFGILEEWNVGIEILERWKEMMEGWNIGRMPP